MKIQAYKPQYVADAKMLPPGFRYPATYLAFVADNPSGVGGNDWCFLSQEKFQLYSDYVRKVTPTRTLVPFMRRNGDDGVACFDASRQTDDPTVFTGTIFAGPHDGWAISESFSTWLEDVQDGAL